jgi:hypothetical protein
VGRLRAGISFPGRARNTRVAGPRVGPRSCGPTSRRPPRPGRSCGPETHARLPAGPDDASRGRGTARPSPARSAHMNIRSAG